MKTSLKEAKKRVLWASRG